MFLKAWALSSAGSERCPYKAEATGSNPVAPTNPMNVKNPQHHLTIIWSILVLGLALCQFNCQRSNPDDAPPFPDKDELVKLYADIIILKNQPGKKENADSLIAGMLKSHGVSEKLYKEILTYYQKNPEKWLIFLEKVDSLVVKRSKEEDGQN